MTAVRLLKQDFRVERWANGQGESLVLARQPDGPNYDWRLSLVAMDTDSGYSAYPEYDRSQVLIDGNGIALRSSARETQLPHIGSKLGFPGEEVFQATLIDGPVRVFNGFARRGKVDLELMLRPVNGRMLLTRDARTQWFGYLVRGRIVLKADDQLLEIESGEGFLLSAETAPWASIDGGGDLALARIQLLNP
jgi:uncharacterized protein